MVIQFWKQDFLKNDDNLILNIKDDDIEDIEELICNYNGDKKNVVMIKSLIDRMFNHFINRYIMNIPASLGEFTLIRMTNALEMKLSPLFYMDYEFLLNETCKLCLTINNTQLLEFYLAFFDESFHYKSERFYYIARSELSKGNIEKAKVAVTSSLKEDFSNYKALLLLYDINKTNNKQHPEIYYLKEAR